MRIESIIADSKVEPRPYQRTITTKSNDMFLGRNENVRGEIEPPARSVLIESPTGSGKTVMGHLVAKALKASFPDLTIGWVAMRRNLLSQAAAENRNLGINVEDIHYISMFDKNPHELLAARQEGRPMLMVVDEAQHDAATSMAHLHNRLSPDYILGLTATPFRTDRVKLCFDKVVKDAGIHQLIQAGYLSRYHHYSIPSWDPETVAEHYMQEPERWGLSIFYWLSVSECWEFAEILRKNSDRVLARLRERRPDLDLSAGLVEVVVGGGGKAELEHRERQIERFRNGEVACLVNCMVLTEGFDAPTLETAWVRDSVKGPTMQMAGRVFRMHPHWKEGNDQRFRHKKIVQSAQTKWPMLKTAMADEQYLWQSDDWRSLTVNPHIQDIAHRARIAIANTSTELPKYIRDKQKRARRLRF